MTREEATERAAQRIRDANGTPEALAWWETHPQLIPAHVYAGAVLDDLWPEVERLTEERDLAVAHDRQPYPTQWAYDRACAALETQRQRADAAEAKVAEWERVHAEHNEVLDIAEDAVLAWRQRAERAEAKQQAVADLLARYDDAPGDAYIPIGLLRVAAADQPTEQVTGLHTVIRRLLSDDGGTDLTDLAAAYEAATGWTAEERQA